MRALLLSMFLLAACSGPPAPRSAPPPAPAPPGAAAPAPAPVAPAAPDPFAAQNLGFEEVDGGKPKAWEAREGVDLASVTDEKHGGGRALRLRATGGEYHAAMTKRDARPFAGKRLRLRGWITTAEAPDGAGLWLRADTAAPAAPVAFVNTFDRRVTGTAPWTAATLEIDVPAGAEMLIVGVMLVGRGTAWFDDLALEVAESTPPPPIAIEGTVTDPAGAPAAGAEVALIGGDDIVQHVRADGSGRFRFDAIAGTWGLSAHRAGAVGAFVAQRRFDASGEVRIALGKGGGVTVRGKTSRPPKPGAYVEIAPLSQHDADLFAVPLAADGTFEALLPRGDKYTVSLLDETGSGTFERKGERAEGVLEIPSLDPPPAEVVAYIGKHGIPLARAEPGRRARSPCTRSGRRPSTTRASRSRAPASRCSCSTCARSPGAARCTTGSPPRTRCATPVPSSPASRP